MNPNSYRNVPDTFLKEIAYVLSPHTAGPIHARMRGCHIDLYVPSADVSQVIGVGGSNVKAVAEELRTKFQTSLMINVLPDFLWNPLWETEDDW